MTKMRLKRRLEAVLGRSWAVLGWSWVVLGRSWAVLGWSWSGLGRSWTLSGRSWSCLRAILGRFGRHLKLKNIDFPCIFQYFLKKTHFSHHIASEAILEANLGQLGAPRASQEEPRGGLGRSWDGLGRAWVGLGVVLGWSWGGLGRSERSRFGQKIVSKTVQRPRWPLDAILDRF